MNKPFIYIGALRRTGSTMLCEALTQPPHSLVFNEPNIMYRRFVVRQNEAVLLKQMDIDLEQFSRKWSGFRRRAMVWGFKNELAPLLNNSFRQIGIKEIFHRKWKKIRRQFPDLRIILTSRDPRDIYLSLQSRYAAGNAIWRGEFSTRSIAQSLNQEFQYQKEMASQEHTLKIRYEDLCRNPRVINDVIRFVESDIQEIGPLGEFLRSDAKRLSEGELHEGIITEKRVSRWKDETQDELIDQAHEVMDLMPEYCDYWEYSR